MSEETPKNRVTCPKCGNWTRFRKDGSLQKHRICRRWNSHDAEPQCPWSSATWESINEIRGALIVKSVKETLTKAEDELLQRLQRLADDRIRLFAPLPIAELEAYLKQTTAA